MHVIICGLRTRFQNLIRTSSPKKRSLMTVRHQLLRTIFLPITNTRMIAQDRLLVRLLVSSRLQSIVAFYLRTILGWHCYQWPSYVSVRGFSVSLQSPLFSGTYVVSFLCYLVFMPEGAEMLFRSFSLLDAKWFPQWVRGWCSIKTRDKKHRASEANWM